MADKLSIAIPVLFDLKQMDKELSSKLKSLASKHKLNLDLNVKGVGNQVKFIKQQMQQIKTPRFNFSKPNSELHQFEQRLNGVVKLLSKNNEVLNINKDEYGKVHIQLRNGEKLLKNYTYQWDALHKTLRRVNRVDTNPIANIDQQVQNLMNSQRKLLNSVDNFSLKNKGLYDAGALENLKNSIKTLDVNLPNAKQTLKDFQFQLDGFKTTALEKGINTANKSAISLGEAFKTAMVKFPIWIASGTLVMGTLHQIGAGVQYIRDLDTAMVDLRKVTEETSEAYKEFETQALDIGKALAKSSVDVVKATANFARMGYDLRESTELAKTAIITTNVGDIEDINKATSFLISTMKGFNIQAEDSIKVTDILNEVSNNHAITVEGLGQALQRSSASMQLAGNSLEETVALITSANALIQNPERIGNAMKTLSMRIRGVDEETGETFPKLEGMLQNIGVEIRETNNSFRSTYDVLKDLSAVWDTIDDFTKADILEQMAGKYQGNVLAAMLQNFTEAEKTLENALMSVGSASKENEIYLESVEAKINRLQVSLESLYKNFLSSDFVKSVVDSLNSAVVLIDTVTGKLGGFPSLITAISLGFMLFNKNIRQTTTSAGVFLKVLPVALQKTDSALKAIAVSARVAGINVKGLTFSFASLSAVLKGIATFSLGAILPIAIITGITVAIQKLTEHFSKLKEEQKKIKEETERTAEVYLSQKQNIDELINKYNQLRDATKDGQTGTLEEQQEYIEVQNKLDQLLPSLTEKVDENGNAHLKTGEALDEEIVRLKELIELKKEEKLIQAEEKYRENLEKQKELREEMIGLEKQANNENNWIRINALSEEEQLQKRIEINNKQREMNDLLLEQKQLLLDNAKTLAEQKGVALDNNVQTALDKFVKTIAIAGKSDKDLKNMEKTLSDIFVLLGSDGKGVKSKSFDELILKLGVTEEQVKSLKQELITLFEQPPENKQVKSFETLSKEFDEVTSKLQSYHKYLKEINEDGKLSGSSMQEIIDKHRELLPYLDDQIALRNKIQESIKEEGKVQKDTYTQMLETSEDFYNAKIKGNKALVKELSDNYQIDLNNYTSLAQAKADIEAKLIQELSLAWADYYDKQSKSFNYDFTELQRLADYDPKAKEQFDEIYKTINKYKDISDRLSEVAKGFTAKIDFASINLPKDKSGNKNSFNEIFRSLPFYKEQAEDIISQNKIIEQSIEDLNKQLQMAEGLENTEKAIQLREQLIDKYQEERKLLSENTTKLRNMQKQISDDFWTDRLGKRIGKHLETLTQEDIANFDELIRKEIYELNKKIANTTSESYKNQLKKQIDQLEHEKDLFHSLINASDYVGGEIAKNIEKEFNNAMKIIDLRSEIKNQLEGIADEVIGIYKDMYAKQKELALKAIDEELDSLEKSHKKKMDFLDEELKQYEEIINAKLRMLDDQADEEDYEKSLAKLQKERQEIINKINILSLDDSLEARARVFELNKDLTKTEEEIEDLKTNRNRDLRKQNLQDQLDAKKKEIDLEKKNAKQVVEINGKRYKGTYEEAKEWLDKQKEATIAHWEEIINNERNYQKIREEVMLGYFDNVKNSFEEFYKFIDANSEKIGRSLHNNLIDKLDEANKKMGNFSDGGNSNSNKKGTTYKGGDGHYYTINPDNSVLHTNPTTGNTELIKDDPALIEALKKKGVLVRHEGGFAGSPANNNVMNLVNKLFNTKPNEVIVKALKDELFIPSKNIMNNFIPNLQNLLGGFSFSPAPVASSGGNVTYDVDIRIDKVTGDKNGADTVIKEFINGIKKKGGKF